MLIFRDPSVLWILGVLAIAFAGINLLNRFFQIRAAQKAEAARKAEKAQEKAERQALRSARAAAQNRTQPPDAREVEPAEQKLAGTPLVDPEFLRQVAGDGNPETSQPCDVSTPLSQDPPMGVPAS